MCVAVKEMGGLSPARGPLIHPSVPIGDRHLLLQAGAALSQDPWRSELWTAFSWS